MNLDCDGTLQLKFHAPLLPLAAHELLVLSTLLDILYGLEAAML